MIKGVKICGISDIKTLDYIINHPHPPKFIGFICNFKKSKRYVSYEDLKKLINVDKKNINFVSVLVNPDNQTLDKISELNFDYYQLYDVDPNKTKFIKKNYGKKIITALTIEKKEDVNKYKLYKDISDIILFDSKGYEKSIGFDHKFLNYLPINFTIMIAGNLDINNLPKLKNIDFFIDLSGSLENELGKKDLQKINYFLSNINHYET
tara:strand:- start:167 stop:790 length:624 start_codon:yes stop_codon:yes gene_type:complete